MAEYDGIAAELPRDWRVALLGDLVQDKGISYGIVQPGNHLEQGVPIIRVKDLKKGRIDTSNPMRVAAEVESAYTRTRLSGGEVLLSLVGSVGESAIVPADLAGWNTARAIAVLRTGDSIPARWLNICLSTELVQRHIRMFLNTTVQATLNLKDVKRLPIVLPPQREREAITNVLAALEDKIAVNDRIAATASLLADTQYARLKKQGTQTRTLGDVLELAYGKSLPANRRNPGPVAVYGSGGPSGWHNTALASGPGVIVGRKGTVGSIYWCQRDFFPIDTTFYVVVKDNQLTLEFAYFLLAGLGLENMNSDSAVPGLNRSRALAISVQVPDGTSIAAFTKQVKPLFAMQEKRDSENKTLTELRKTLLSELMSGRLRVKDAEKVVEDAV